MLSNGVNPPYRGYIGLVNKNPQMATFHNAPADVALLPVSYPMSDALSTQSNKAEIFSAWEATINEAEITDGMIFFIMRSEDIGNPDYTNDLKALIMYAKNKNLTFTTPDVIASHLKNIQNIQYSGSINNDMATINMTNNAPNTPKTNVTTLPTLYGNCINYYILFHKTRGLLIAVFAFAEFLVTIFLCF